DCNLPANEISGQCSEPAVISLCPAVFDRHVATFNKTGVIQPLSNDCEQECIGRPRTAAQDSDNWKLLLGKRRERPHSCRTNDCSDEIAASHCLPRGLRLRQQRLITSGIYGQRNGGQRSGCTAACLSGGLAAFGHNLAVLSFRPLSPLLPQSDLFFTAPRLPV